MKKVTSIANETYNPNRCTGTSQNYEYITVRTTTFVILSKLFNIIIYPQKTPHPSGINVPAEMILYLLVFTLA